MEDEPHVPPAQPGSSESPNAEASADPRIVRLRKYLPHLATFDMGEGEKLALLQTLDDLAKTFVDCAFGVNLTGHPHLHGSETPPQSR